MQIFLDFETFFLFYNFINNKLTVILILYQVQNQNDKFQNLPLSNAVLTFGF